MLWSRSFWSNRLGTYNKNNSNLQPISSCVNFKSGVGLTSKKYEFIVQY